MIRLDSYSHEILFTELRLEEVSLQVRGAVIIGKQRTVVWDTLCHPADMLPVREITYPRLVTVVYSHADWDHCWGTSGLDWSEVIAHQTAFRRLKETEPAVLNSKRREHPALFDRAAIQLPTLTFDRTLNLDLGGLNLELYSLPGHTQDAIVGFIPEVGMLLGGDAIENPLPYLNENLPIEPWVQQLRRWADDPRVQIVVPSHGAIAGKDLLEKNIRYLTNLASGVTAPPPDLDEEYQKVHKTNLGTLGLEEKS